jgi:hypothetical protein
MPFYLTPNWMVVNGHQQFKIIEALETKSKSGICDMLMGISDSVVKKQNELS